MPTMFSIDFKNSYYKKTNHKTYNKAIQNVIRTITVRSEAECKKECPVDTGQLKRSHFMKYPDQSTGEVWNRASYADYVVHGTQYQQPNNYPERAVRNVRNKELPSSILKRELKKEGVI